MQILAMGYASQPSRPETPLLAGTCQRRPRMTVTSRSFAVASTTRTGGVASHQLSSVPSDRSKSEVTNRLATGQRLLNATTAAARQTPRRVARRRHGIGVRSGSSAGLCTVGQQPLRPSALHPPLTPAKENGLALDRANPLLLLVRLAGIEPTTPWFVAKYSIQLSYSRELRMIAATKRLGLQPEDFAAASKQSPARAGSLSRCASSASPSQARRRAGVGSDASALACSSSRRALPQS